MVAVRNANQGMYDDMEVAKTNIIGRVGVFSDTFSPKIDELKELKIILDVVLITFNILASGLWNLVGFHSKNHPELVLGQRHTCLQNRPALTSAPPI